MHSNARVFYKTPHKNTIIVPKDYYNSNSTGQHTKLRGSYIIKGQRILYTVYGCQFCFCWYNICIWSFQTLKAFECTCTALLIFPHRVSQSNLEKEEKYSFCTNK